MMQAFFVSDLHGKFEKYLKLLDQIRTDEPEVVLLGGDLFPHHSLRRHRDFEHIDDFVVDFLIPKFVALQENMRTLYPQIFVILGNDDARIEEEKIIEAEKYGIWKYLHMRRFAFAGYDFYGYSFVPPTPFLLKDWERYDVSRFVDPGCVPPTEGYRTTAPDEDIGFTTIQQHLELLTMNADFEKSVFLFHSPPYNTLLDRAALDGVMVDHVPVDVHVGSIAIQRFIETRQPHITLHGHIHESARITGSWMQQIGKTYAFNAAHDGTELSLIKFRLDDPKNAERILL
jgi:Icc-related predicted phosphoesterase